MLNISRRIWVAVFSLAVSVSTCSSAASHALLTESVPAEGETLSVTPAQFRFIFREPVSALLFRLVSPDGAVSALSPVETYGENITVNAGSELRSGTHLLVWRVLGQDGHPTGSVVTFAVGAPSETPLLPDFRASGLTTAIWITRVLWYLGLCLGVGGTFFRAWIDNGRKLPSAASVVIGISLIGIFPLSLASIGMQGLDSLDAGWSALVTAGAWEAGIKGSFGWSIALAAIASFIAFVGALVPRGLQRIISIVALVSAGVGMAASGHSGSALLTPASFTLVLHTICILFWVGSLVPLGMILHASPIERGDVLKRFSAAIPIPLGLLVLTGVVLSVLRLGSPANLLSTGYGAVLAAKVGLVLALLILAAYNRFQLTPRFASAPAATSGTFTKSICAELVIVAAIFGVLGLWRFVPPPSSAAPERPTIAYMKSTEVTALVTIAPSTSSARSIAVALFDNNAQPVDANQVWMTLSYITLNTTPVRRMATPVGHGKFSLEGVVMPNPGLWRVQLDVLANNKHTLLDQQVLVTDVSMGWLLNRQSPARPDSTDSMLGMDM